MGIGAISGLGGMSMYGIGSNYNIKSVYGNPKSLQPVEKIGEEDYTGNPFAVLENKNDAEEGVNAVKQFKPVDLQAASSQMMMGSRFLLEGIPEGEL